MTDLFAMPPIPGLALAAGVVTASQERLLIDQCLALDLVPFRFQGWEGKRLTRSFGRHYDFDTDCIGEAEPIPDWLLGARARAAAALGRDPEAFVQALVIRYDPGAGIGWHRDRPQFHEVIGLSLEHPAELAFRRRRGDRRFDRVKLLVEPRSAYLISGEARSSWEHGIASHDFRRFSLTFRSLR